MATILELDAVGALIQLDPQLGPREMEERRIFLLPDLLAWFEDVLPTLESSWNIEDRPKDQMYELTWAFCSQRVLNYGWQFKPLRYAGGGMWELKTQDLRTFGWFPEIDTFIAGRADTAERIKEHNLYQGYCGEIERLRNELDLNEPKYIDGGDPNAVVSNFTFP